MHLYFSTLLIIVPNSFYSFNNYGGDISSNGFDLKYIYYIENDLNIEYEIFFNYY